MAEAPSPPDMPVAETPSVFAQVNWSRVDAIFEEKSRSLVALAKAAGESPDTFFVGRNFRGISLKSIDVRGVSLEHANLVGTGVRHAVIDGTTKLDGAKIDAVDRRALRRKGFLPVPRRDNRHAGESFNQLLARQDEFYVRGCDYGDTTDLEVAIKLSRLLVRRASDAFQRGAAYNQLGNALQVLGERESDPARLRQAVEAYRAALDECTRERFPLEWAMTRNNLGNALLSLGQRESDPAWLRQAVEVIRATLKERTRERVPLKWSGTQNNLGGALRSLGQCERDPALLREAVEACRAALKERTRERVPLYWATTKNNIGAALCMLVEHESDPALLRQAAEAFRDALKEYTRERIPYLWAQTRENMAIAFLSIYRLTSEETDRQQALAAIDDALVVYRDAESGYDISTAEALRAQILAAAPAP
jgi:tetratricopeptide (TPR) repeat protein